MIRSWVKGNDAILSHKIIRLCVYQGVGNTDSGYATYSSLGLDPGPYYEGSITPDLEWPAWVVYSVIPLGGLLLLWRFFEGMVQFLQHGTLPRHQVAHVAGLEE